MKKRPYLLLALLACSSTTATASLCSQPGYTQGYGRFICNTTRCIHTLDVLVASNHFYRFAAEPASYDVILLSDTAACAASTSNTPISPLPHLYYNSRTIPAVHRKQASCTPLDRPGSCTATSSVTDKRHAHTSASPLRAACWGRPASHSLITTNITSSTAPRRFPRPFLRCPDTTLQQSLSAKKLDEHPTDMSDSNCRKGIVSKPNPEHQIK